jgi:hypothetical protein
VAKFRIGLEKWIQEALNDPDKDGPCVAIGLFHVKSSMGGAAREEIHTTRLAGTATARQLADLMQSKAETFAGGLTGAQTFRVGAFYGENPTEPQATYVLLVNGVTEHDGLSTEGPTTAGMVTQMMRHNEALVQQSYQQTSRLFERMDRHSELIARSYTDMVEHSVKLRQENVEAWEFVKKLVFMRAEEEHEREMKVLEHGRSTEERKKLLSMIPALANTVVGREVFPQSAADGALLDAIFEHVKPEQLQMAIQYLGLPAEVTAPLMNRAAQYAEKQAKVETEVTNGKVLAMGAGDE